MIRAYGTILPNWKPVAEKGEHDNGNGTISLLKPNGKWLCITPEGREEERDSPGGVWESFVKCRGCIVAIRTLEKRNEAGELLSSEMVVYVLEVADEA